MNAALRSIVTLADEARPPPATRIERNRVSLVIAGARGRVASALRAQLAREQPTLEDRCGIRLVLAGAFDRHGSCFDAAGMAPLAAPTRMAQATLTHSDPLQQLHDLAGPCILVDASGSQQWADAYVPLLNAGIGIVTANKRAHSARYSDWLALRAAAGKAPLHYETTVGAALPVISTLHSLAARGERVLGIEGVLSGSLSFILTRVQQGTPLSAAVAEAIRLGYTEPDPLEDIGFSDLRRKLLILAREAGQRLEPEQIRVDALLPDDVSLDALLAGTLDAEWSERAARALAHRQKLVAVASWQLAGQARISVRAEPLDSVLASLAGGENIVRIQSEYHDALPLCIRGPGAGPAVTAAGMFSDMISAARAWLPTLASD
jgi:homoserine dehydrogenase